MFDIQHIIYIILFQIIPAIPETLKDAKDSYPDIVFCKEPRAAHSALTYLQSTFDGKDLLVGFDSHGKPLPLDEVKKYSKHFEAIFNLLIGPCDQ